MMRTMRLRAITKMALVVVLPLVLVLLSCRVVVKAAHPDTNPECEVWAQRGECEVSSKLMYMHSTM